MLSVILGLQIISQEFIQQSQMIMSRGSAPFEAPVSAVYIPTGFDDNDIPQFIVEGVFENACYQVASVRLTEMHQQNSRHFHFFVEAYKIEGPACTDEKKKSKNVPYLEAVTLPMLPVGQYEVWHSQKKDGPAGLLKIVKAPTAESAPTGKESKDTFLYAIVDGAFVEPNQLQKDHYLLTLFGKFTNNCQDLDYEKLKIEKKTEHIVEVLPIIKRTRTEGCLDTPVSFVRPLLVPEALKEGHYLFHIRTMEGRSKNFTFDLKSPD